MCVYIYIYIYIYVCVCVYIWTWRTPNVGNWVNDAFFSYIRLIFSFRKQCFITAKLYKRWKYITALEIRVSCSHYFFVTSSITPQHHILKKY